MDLIEKYIGFGIMDEEKLFMHIRKTKAGIKKMEQELEQAKERKNKKLIDKLKKEIKKSKKSLAGSEDFHKKGQKNEAKSMSTPMVCIECGKKFKKVIGPKTIEVRCPKCKGYDTEPA